MRINSINTQTPTTNTTENPSFKGRILTKGKWTKNLKNAFLNNPEVQKAATNTKLDIVAIMKRTSANNIDYLHYPGENLYKLTLTSQNPNPTFMEKVKTFLGLGKKMNITRNYHSESGTIIYMDNRITADRLKRKLDL